MVAAGAISFVSFDTMIMKSDHDHIHGDSVLNLLMAKQPVLCDAHVPLGNGHLSSNKNNVEDLSKLRQTSSPTTTGISILSGYKIISSLRLIQY